VWPHLLAVNVQQKGITVKVEVNQKVLKLTTGEKVRYFVMSGAIRECRVLNLTHDGLSVYTDSGVFLPVAEFGDTWWLADGKSDYAAKLAADDFDAEESFDKNVMTTTKHTMFAALANGSGLVAARLRQVNGVEREDGSGRCWLVVGVCSQSDNIVTRFVKTTD